MIWISLVYKTTISIDFTYLSIYPQQQEHAKLCIQWYNLVGIFDNKKTTHQFPCWSAGDAGHTNFQDLT